MLGKTRGISVLARSHQRHVRIVGQVVEELGEELGQPPHANKITAGAVVGVLPAALLALIAFFLIVVAVELDNLPCHLLIYAAIEADALLLAKRLNHESLVSLHNDRLLSHI